MVVILATALALGVSAVAACVVPWLYCRPTDSADDDSQATAIGEDTASQSRSSNEHNNTTSTMGIRINGFNFVKVEIAPQSTGNHDTAQSTIGRSETANSTSFNAYLPQNRIGESRFQLRAADIQPHCPRIVDPCVSGVSNFASTAVNTKNSEDPSQDAEESWDAESLEVAITNIQIIESRLPNSGSTELVSSNASEDTEEVAITNIQIMESRLPNSGSTELVSSNASEDTEESRDGRSLEVAFTNIQITESRLPNSGSTELVSSNASEDTEEVAITNIQIIESRLPTSGSTELVSSNASEDTEESRNGRSLEVAITNIQIMESRLPNSGSTEPSLMVQIEENATDTPRTTESSNPTGESSTETTLRSSSGVSGLDNSESNVQTDEPTGSSKNAQSVEPTSEDARTSKMESIESGSSDPGLTNPETLEPGSLERIKEDTATTLRTPDPSNPSDDSCTERTDGTSRSRESERSFGPSNVLADAIVEPSNISEDLDTIPEVSSYSASSREASPSSKSSKVVFPKSGTSPDSSPTVSHNHENSDTKKISRRARIASTLSNGFKRFIDGIKLDKTHGSSRGEVCQELHTESVHSLSAGTKVPAGHSTLISEEQRLLNAILRRRSMTSRSYLPKPLEDPRISIDGHLSEAELELQTNEEPLDLSIRSSSVCDEKTKELPRTEKKVRSCTSGRSRQIFREVKEYLRVRGGSRSNAEGTSCSDSLKFYGDPSKSVGRDENQNFSSASSTAVNNRNFDGNREIASDPEANVSFPDRTNGKLKQRRFNGIFNFGNKDRSKGNDKVSSSGRKGKASNSVPVEFQRNSMGISSKPNERSNAHVESTTSESPEDSYPYREELHFAILDDERYLREPCTEL